MNEVIEGEAVETRMVPVTPAPVGVRALAELSDAEFERNLAAIRKGQERVLRMQKELLVDEVDYGNVPGVDKPSLAKPGAEKLCLAYGLVARVETTCAPGDGIVFPAIRYDATCWLHVGSFEGPIVGMGHGTCSSFEVKYRYRDGKLKCPQCSQPLRHSKAPRTGWYCWEAKGGCGWQTSVDDDPAVKGQVVGQVDNPDPFDLANTIMKMAEKRAHVDATLRTTGASGIFTQDMEENAPAEAPKAAEKAATPRTATSPARQAAKPANVPPVPTPADLAALHGETPVPTVKQLAEAAETAGVDLKAYVAQLFPEHKPGTDLDPDQRREVLRRIKAI